MCVCVCECVKQHRALIYDSINKKVHAFLCFIDKA